MASHNKTGEIGEKLAVTLLEEKGYEIIKTNYRRKWAELDIICQAPDQRSLLSKLLRKPRQKTLVFIEVKTRTGERFGKPEDSINKEKKWRLKRSAKAYTAFNNYKGQYRIDAICIVLGKNKKPVRVTHHENITGF